MELLRERITKIENNIATVDLGAGIVTYQVLPDLRFATRNGVYDTKRAMVELDPQFEKFTISGLGDIEMIHKNIDDVLNDPMLNQIFARMDEEENS